MGSRKRKRLEASSASQPPTSSSTSLFQRPKDFPIKKRLRVDGNSASGGEGETRNIGPQSPQSPLNGSSRNNHAVNSQLDQRDHKRIIRSGI